MILSVTTAKGGIKLHGRAAWPVRPCSLASTDLEVGPTIQDIKMSCKFSIDFRY
jgi:hypothetical protein